VCGAIILSMPETSNQTGGSAVAPAPAIAQAGQPESKGLGNWLSEATIIAASPVAAYFVTFAYHAGHAQFFGIPRELVTVDLKMFVLASSSLVLIAGVCLTLSLLFFGFWPHGKRDSVLYRRAVALFPSFFLSVMLILTSDLRRWYNWFAAVIPLAILVFVLFVVPLLLRSNKGTSLADRLETHERSQRDDSVFDYYMRQGMGVLLVTGVWVYIAVQVAYALGESESKRQTDFFVRSTSPETVVLSIYGDCAITAKFSRDKKTVEKNIMVVKITEAPTVAMHSERIGPLQPEK
jgi:hypothetical protein